jgi:hypothetical protein
MPVQLERSKPRTAYRCKTGERKSCATLGGARGPEPGSPSDFPKASRVRCTAPEIYELGNSLQLLWQISNRSATPQNLSGTFPARFLKTNILP